MSVSPNIAGGDGTVLFARNIWLILLTILLINFVLFGGIILVNSVNDDSTSARNWSNLLSDPFFRVIIISLNVQLLATLRRLNQTVLTNPSYTDKHSELYPELKNG